MRKLLLGAAIFMALEVPAQAADLVVDLTGSGCTSGNQLPMTSFAFEQITVSSTALPLTASKYNPTTFGPALMAVITTETDSVRFTVDGTTPTSSVGTLVTLGGVIRICQPDMVKFKVIRVTNDAPIVAIYQRTPQ